MMEWYESLTVLGKVYLWIGVIATALLIIQIVLMCFSSFGGDLDLDGDGDIDVDVDSGVSVFTVKGMTAFFAVGGWVGLLTCSLVSDAMQWLSVIAALVSGVAAWALVVVLLRLMFRLQCNGALEPEKLIGQQATVYVAVPAGRSGRGKITLNAQGRYMELDAVTDGDKLTVDKKVEIVANESDYMVVRPIADKQADDTVTVINNVMNN